MADKNELVLVACMGGVLLGKVVEGLCPGKWSLVLEPAYEVQVMNQVTPQGVVQRRGLVPYQGLVDSKRVEVNGDFVVCPLGPSDAAEFKRMMEKAEESRQAVKAKRAGVLVVPGMPKVSQ